MIRAIHRLEQAEDPCIESSEDPDGLEIINETSASRTVLETWERK
jgi:hypothetical protein